MKLKLIHIHKYILDRRNEKKGNQFKHTYKCTKCGKKKVEFTNKRMEY